MVRPRAKLDIKRVQSRLRGNTKRLRSTFSGIRLEASPSDYPELVATFYEHPFYKLKLFSPAFPKSLADLKRLQPLYRVGLVQEMHWVASIVERYAASLGEFMTLRQEFEQQWLAGKKAESKTVLDQIENRFGWSFWLFSARSLGGDGAEESEDYINLSDIPGINGYTYYLLFYLRYRNSAGVNLQQIREALPQVTRTNPSLPTYILYKIAPFSLSDARLSEEEIEVVLRHETNSSAVDLCLTSIDIFSGIMARQDLAHLHEDARRCLGRIERAVRRPPADPGRRLALLSKFYDRLVDQRFRSSGDLASNLLFAALGIEDRSMTELQSFGDAYDRIACRSSGRNEDSLELERQSTCLSFLSFGKALFEAVKRAHSRSSHFGLLGSSGGIWNWGVQTGEIATSKIEFREQDALLLSDFGGDGSSSAFFRAVETPLDEVAEITDPILFDLHSRPAETADSYLGSLLDGHFIRAAVQALIGRGDIDRALKFVALAYVRDPDIWPLLPLEELIEVDRQNKSDQIGGFAKAIVFDAATKHVSPNFARERAYAVEDVWEAEGVSTPSQIAVPDGVDRELVVYYLSRLAVPDIMDESDAFQSISELEEERIRVCQILTDIDAVNSERYLAEIKSRTRWLVVYQGVRLIEQSKIYVDVPNLRLKFENTLKPEFERLLALLNERQTKGEVEQLISRDIALYRDDEITGQVSFSFLQGDPRSVLVNIMEDVWESFAADTHSGLDVYLSTRIRHGTLKGHLRNPIELQNLILQKTGDEYLDSPYWSEHADVPSWSVPGINEALRTYSHAVDTLIARLNGEALRVRTSSGKGWFDFSLSAVEVLIVESRLSDGPIEFQAFIDLLLELLNDRLQIILSRVRDALFPGIKRIWQQDLQDLRDRSQQVDLGLARAEFDASITAAMVGSDLAFERVSTWFTLTDRGENPDYAMDLPIEIARQSINNCFGVNALLVEIDVPASLPVLVGRSLTSLVDVFFILFENVLKHSGAADGVSSIAEVDFTAASNNIYIRVANPLSGSNIESVRSKLAVARQTLASANEDARLVTEGGTGFHKLRKILSLDLGAENAFDFKVEGGNFEIEILLDIQEMIR